MSEFDALDISESKKRYVRDLLNPLLEDMVMDSLFAANLNENPTNYLLAWSNLRQKATNSENVKLDKENQQLREKIKQCERSITELGRRMDFGRWSVLCMKSCIWHSESGPRGGDQSVWSLKSRWSCWISFQIIFS